MSINCKIYPLNSKETKILKEFWEEEEKKEYITPGSSPYTAPVFFVGKKDSQELRPVMAYWELNKWTKRDNNPLPNIKIILENLQGGELFSKFNLRWGYKNLRIKPEDWEKAAFKMVFGTFILNMNYFGLTNTPPMFQRVVYLDLRPLLQKYPRKLGNYLDDLWIITKKDTARQKLHEQITHEVLQLLEENSYFLKLSKSEFGVETMNLLGWQVGNGEIWIDPDKISRIKNWPRTLKNKKDVQIILGVLGYQRPQIKGLAKIAKPLVELTKKKENDEFKWTKEAEEALNQLIDIITLDPVLKCPDPEKQFEIEVDASAFTLGAVLSQKGENGKKQECRYFSKALNETERNYDIWDREFMAVIMGLRNWRHLLIGSPYKVIVYTDHTNLQYYQHLQKINRCVARYISELADYNIKLWHLPGIKNKADPLSRRPDHDNGSKDNKSVLVLPKELFAHIIETKR